MSKYKERLEKVEDEVKILKELISQEKTGIILVPENIKIEKDCGTDLGIVFNDEKQRLYWSSYGEVYNVGSADKRDFVKCKLVSCKFEDLKAGDTAFRSSDRTPDFSELNYYCKILGNKQHCSISKIGDVFVCESSWNFWWKVEEAEE